MNESPRTPSLLTKLVAGIGLLLLLASSTGTAYTGWREAVLPSGAEETVTGRGAHLALCERVSDDLPVSPNPSPLYCEGSGLSAQFSDIGCSVDFSPAAGIPPILYGDDQSDNDATAGNGFANGVASTTACLDDIDGSGAGCCNGAGDGSDAAKDDYAEGTVTFTAGGTGGPGDFNYLIGNDRDDDGVVTELDLDGSNAAGCNGNPLNVVSGCYDDEFLAGTVASGALPSTTGRFCFTRDREFSGGDWDDILVYLGANVPGPTPYVGTLKVEMTVNSATAFTPACTARSGHSDANAQLGGAPLVGWTDHLDALALVGGYFPGPLKTGIDCEILLLPQAVPGSSATGSCGAINCRLLGLTAFVAVIALVDVTVNAIGGCLNDSAGTGTGILALAEPGDDESNGIGIVSATAHPLFPVGFDSADTAPGGTGGTFVCSASTPAGTGLGGLGVCSISPI